MNDFRRFFLPLTTRKPESWAACPLCRDLTARHHDMLRQLPVIETAAQPLENFLGDPPPRECVVRFGKHYFYVNPEGYRYARYVFKFEPKTERQTS